MNNREREVVRYKMWIWKDLGGEIVGKYDQNTLRAYMKLLKN